MLQNNETAVPSYRKILNQYNQEEPWGWGYSFQLHGGDGNE